MINLKSTSTTLYVGIVWLHIHLWVFPWPTRLLVVQKSIVKVLNAEGRQTANFFFLSLFLQLDSIRTVFAQNNNILHYALHNPNAFSQLQSLIRHLKPSTQELWLHLQCHFQILYAKTVVAANFWTEKTDQVRMLCEWLDFCPANYGNS